MKNIFFAVSLILLFGCTLSQKTVKISHFPITQYYVKKEFLPLGAYYCFEVPNRVSKREFRLMQSQFQNIKVKNKRRPMNKEKPTLDEQIRDQKAKLFDIQVQINSLQQAKINELQLLQQLITQKKNIGG